MISPIKKILNILVVLLLLGFGSCMQEPDDDLLGFLLGGEFPLLFSYYSQSGPENNGGELESSLLATINLSKSKVYCVFEDISLESVFLALHSAHLRAVDVRVGLDEDHKNGTAYLLLAQYMDTTGLFPHLQVGNSGDGEVYMNICVGDDTRVWASSAAPTIMDMYGENAFAIYFQSDPDGLAKKFSTVLDVTTNGSFGSAKQRLNRRNHWLLAGMDVGIYFAPEESPLEGFMVPRLRNATSSILMYSNEFFSNELDASDVRENEDLAYEIARSGAPHKQIIVNMHSYTSADPDAASSLNSIKYAAQNGLSTKIVPGGQPDGGMSFIVLDGNDGKRMSFLSSHPYSKRTDSSHDGFTFVFENIRFATELSTFLDALRTRAIDSPSTTGDDFSTANNLEVVISEINWMGGYKKDGNSGSGEYVEFYTNHATPVNVSGWKFICNDGADTTVFTFPGGTVLAPKEYYLVSRSTGSFVKKKHLKMSTWNLIPDNSNSCRLEDANATIIDQAGTGSYSWDKEERFFGLYDSTNKIKKSFERINLNSLGNVTSNWHTNSHTSWHQNYNFDNDYIFRTFGTPGYGNSQNIPVTRLLDGIIITEVADVASGDFFELYNTTSQDVDLAAANAYFQRDSSCTIAASGMSFVHELSGIVPAGGRLGIGEVGNGYGISDILPLSFNINGSTYCMALTVGNAKVKSVNDPNVIEFLVFGTAGDSGGSSVGTFSSGNSASRCPDNNGAWTMNTALSAGAANLCP